MAVTLLVEYHPRDSSRTVLQVSRVGYVRRARGGSGDETRLCHGGSDLALPQLSAIIHQGGSDMMS